MVRFGRALTGQRPERFNWPRARDSLTGSKLGRESPLPYLFSFNSGVFFSFQNPGQTGHNGTCGTAGISANSGTGTGTGTRNVKNPGSGTGRGTEI